MAVQLHDTMTPRRAYHGSARLGQRDIDGLSLCAEHYGAPYDLLAAALGAQPARLRGIVARWRRAGYADTGRLCPGPAWCWLTPAGMGAAGLGYPARRPALARLAQIRAVLAARLWLQASPAWHQGHAWWHSGRHIRAVRPGARARHLPAAEIHWPSLPASPYAGQVWAVEVELTPKPLARTARIISALQGPARYAQVIYLTTPVARLVAAMAADALPAHAAPVVIRDLPPFAFTPDPGLITVTSGRDRPPAGGCRARQSRPPNGTTRPGRRPTEPANLRVGRRASRASFGPR